MWTSPPPLPELGTNWRWLDYFIWYNWAGGDAVDIGATGLLNEVVKDPQIIAIMEEWEDYVITNAADCYAFLVENGTPEDEIGWFIRLHPTKPREYHFDGPGYWWAWLTGRSNLIILGDGDPANGHGVYVAAEGHVTGSTYEITFIYVLNDEFSAPWNFLDFLDKPWLKYESGTPYPLYGIWSRTFRGSLVNRRSMRVDGGIPETPEGVEDATGI